MPWPIPQPGEVSSRAAGVYEALPALQGIDARGPNSIATANARVTEMVAQDLYLYQGTLAQELMPDTAVMWLSRHAAIWGVPRNPATASSGNMLITATSAGAVTIAQNTQFSYAPAGLLFTVSAATTIPANTQGAVPVICTTTGSATDLTPGATLTPVAPIAGINPQSGTVDSDGLTGGLDIEALDSWRSRIIARIQDTGDAGTVQNYTDWTRSALPSVGAVQVYPNWSGPGNVGVVFAMPGPATPTQAEINTVSAYIATRRPVTANIIVLGATLQPINFEYKINPNTTQVQQAGQQALALQMQADATIGGTIFMSRMDAALSTASGEISHDRVSPTADVTVPQTAIATLGTITWDTLS